MPKTEKWLPVVGFEKRYEVSNQGRVRKVCKWTYKPKRRLETSYRIVNGTVLNGYRRVCIKKQWRKVSRMMLEAFIGPCPSGYYACHKDGNPNNDRLHNLRWGSPKSNQQDRVYHGTDNRGEKNTKSKLTKEQVLEILRFAESGKVLAAQFGVSNAAISCIRTGRNWRYLPRKNPNIQENGKQKLPWRVKNTNQEIVPRDNRKGFRR